MHRILICLISICFSTCLVKLNAQTYCNLLYDNQWILGYDDDTINDDFGGSMITFFPEFRIERKFKTFDQIFTFASINNRSGSLLLSSNGCDIFNADGDVISGEDGINPGETHDLYCDDNEGYPGIHNMFFLPDSYDSSLYYLVHISETYNRAPNAPFLVQHEHFYITSIRQSPENNELEVIEKNKIVFTDTGMIGQPTTAVKHANGLDWWMITPDRWSNGFNTILLGQSGANYLGKQYIGLPTIPRADGGQGKFSPDGSHFAWYQPRNGLFFYDFDRSSGMLSNFRHVDVPVGADLVTGGLEFSPQGRFLYVNHYFSLYQVDVLAEDLQASLTHIADYDGFADPSFLYTIFLYMERTPDKRIIMNPRYSSQYFHIIQEPDKKGTDCRFEQHAFKLPTFNYLTIPHFPNYRLGALGEPMCDSLIVSADPPHLPVMDKLYRLYPNPAQSILYVQPLDSELPPVTSVFLVDVLGKGRRMEFSPEMDISTIPAGIYFLFLFDKNDMILQKSTLVILEKN